MKSVQQQLTNDQVIDGEPDATEIIAINDDINRISDEFSALLDETWYTSLDVETVLHERIEETMTAFFQNVAKMIDEFVEQVGAFFAEMNEAEHEFSSRLQQMASDYLHSDSAPDAMHPTLRNVRTCWA